MNMLRMRKAISSLALAMLLLAAASAWAVQPGPLPQFSAVSLAGKPVSGAQIAADGKWLLIYVQGDCGPCTELLGLFRANEKEVPLGRQIAIIVGGASPEDAAGLKARFEGLAEATWLADPQMQAKRQLKLTSAPTVIGLRDHMAAWSVVGVMSDQKMQMEMFNNWLRE